MKSPDSDLRKLLQTIATSKGLLIYDRVPEQVTSNYVHVSDITSADNFTVDRVIWETELMLDVVTFFDTNKGGRKTADEIGNILLTELLDKYQMLTDFMIVKSTLLSMNYVDEANDRGYIIRKLIRISFELESI